MEQKNLHMILAEVRKHFAAVIVCIMETAGTAKGVQLARREKSGSDGQRNRHIQSLSASETYSTFPGCVGMFITKTAAALYTTPQGGIFTTMRNQIPDDHFTFFCH
jgi:hypothetical protein